MITRIKKFEKIPKEIEKEFPHLFSNMGLLEKINPYDIKDKKDYDNLSQEEIKEFREEIN